MTPLRKEMCDRLWGRSWDLIQDTVHVPVQQFVEMGDGLMGQTRNFVREEMRNYTIS